MTKYVYDERTAPSAPICTFEDGVDGIPTKSLVVTIPPTLTGVSSLGCYVYGKNMIDLSSLVVGYVKTNGTFETAHSNGEMRSDFIPVKPDTTYYFSIFETTGTAADWVGIGEYTTNNTSGFVRRDSYWRFTTGSTTKYIVVSARNLEQATKIQLEIGNDPTTWEAYTAPTVYTANLGRTIYGGTADIVNGTAEPTNYLDTANAETNTNNSVSITCDGNGKYTATGTATGGSANITFTLKTPCEIKSGMYLHLMNSDANSSASITLQKQDNTTIYAPTLSPANRIADLSSYAGQTIYSIRFYVANGASFEMTLTPMLCYSSAVTPYSPYFEPFTFDGQEINTRLGYNAFWSEEGDTEVTYYIQIPVEEKYIINGETLSDIADAIREKKQTSAPILTEDMADEISSIEMGGSDLFDLASQNPFNLTDETYKTHALTIPDRMFNNNQRIRTVNISGIKTVESYAFIQCKATSLSFPDVETIGYQAFFQCRGASDVPLSIPNVVTIGEEAFKEAYVCGESPSHRSLDISKCVSIGNNAFRSTRINGFKMDSVETLGNMPWYGSWFSMTTVVFPKLKTAHDQMCRGMNFTNLVIGPDWESCGGGFAGYDMDWRNKYVYVYATTPPTMGGDFSLWKPPVAFYVPADSVDAYKAAPYWSQYASIILPLPSDHLTIDTWL